VFLKEKQYSNIYNEDFLDLKSLTVPFVHSKEKAWDQLVHRMNTIDQADEFSKLRPVYYFRIAATILLLVGVFTVFSFHYSKKYQTVSRQNLNVILPDHSLVTLNFQSKITYKPLAFRLYKQIVFDGEGYFNIRKSSSFVIHSGDYKVNVLGTVFNIRNRTDFFEVLCYEGRISIVSKVSGKEFILLKNSRFVSENNRESVSNFEDAAITPDWMRGEYVFENTPLNEVFYEIEGNYCYKIEYNNTETRFYSGYFNTGQYIEKVMDLVCVPMKLKYKIVGSRILIQPNE